ncbi:MAG: UDP-N-acetylmuramate--L-alanine ligase [Sedimentisphaerales bacterium]|nr:UDP-N-acetylmuramate--L-alanine ligase [Sedimentisphaerales bacterium]
METHPEKALSPATYQAVERGRGWSLSGKTCHFIGIGGIGMSGLAKLLMKNGATVVGSDMEDSHVIRELGSLGVRIFIGHDGPHVPTHCDAVVISAAIRPTNPEVQAAQTAGFEVLKYAEMLGELMDCYKGIAVCGTHGKSTTSGWLAYVLDQCRVEPSFIVGADIPQLGGSSGVGKLANWFIAEACEYDRSFLNLHPRIGVMLNIEQDHLDYYKDEQDIVDAFCDFAAGIREEGFLIANGEDRNVAKVLAGVGDRIHIRTFGRDETCYYRADNLAIVDGTYQFDVIEQGRSFGRVHLGVPGEHNVYNALAVIATAREVGVDAETILNCIGGFTGVDRRLMLKKIVKDITVLDDYAHHPTEIRASLQAVRQRFAPRRLWCVFQPHQYSRTRFLLEDFADSFALADITIVPEIYFVRDTAESKQKVNAQVLVERIRSRGSEAMFIPDFDAIVDYLKTHVEPANLVMTMGAGPIWKVADEYLQWLTENR